MTKTDEFIRALRDNGYQEGRADGKRCFWKHADRRDLSFRLLGKGWVHVYEREYPSSEGWSMYNARVSEARKLIGWGP